MSTRDSSEDAVRQLLLVMSRLVGRVKRTPMPDELASLDLAPRHLSLLSMLLLDGPQTVSRLAEVLGVAPTTVSLIVSELSRKGVLVRREDDADRRRRIIDLSAGSRPVISQWLMPFADSWRHAVKPLSAAERRMFVDTLLRYEAGFTDA
jgi:DNA-binding MarR family transcriptional regulator